jgi:hypothetical protein
MKESKQQQRVQQQLQNEQHILQATAGTTVN